MKDFASKIELAELRERVRQLVALTARLRPGNYGALAIKVQEVAVALGRGTDDEVDYYLDAKMSGNLKFETYEMPITGMSALREYETSAALSDKGGDTRLKGLEKPDRPKGLNWFHDNVFEEVPRDFKRTSLDQTIEDPETWDSTVSCRKFEAAVR